MLVRKIELGVCSPIVRSFPKKQISFSASDNIDKSSSNENINKNKNIKLIGVGLASIAALAGLFAAGRTGKLSGKIQKLFGGTKPKKEYFTVGSKVFDTEAINTKLNRTIPKLNENQMHIDMSEALKYTDMSDVMKAEVRELNSDLCYKTLLLPNGLKKTIIINKYNKNARAAFLLEDRNNNPIYYYLFDESGHLNGIATADNKTVIALTKNDNSEVAISDVFTKIGNQKFIYNSKQELVNYIIAENGIEKTICYSKNSKGGLYPHIVYYRTVSDKPGVIGKNIKAEYFNEDASKLLAENYYDENGKLAHSVMSKDIK